MNNILKILFVLLIASSVKLTCLEKYVLKESIETKELRIKEVNKYLGITEEKNNNIIYEFQKSVDISKNAAWCYAFQYYCYNNVCNDLGITNILPKTGVSNELFNYAKRIGEKQEYRAKAGDYIVWKAVNSWRGHIGIIEKVNKNNNTVITIEGNTGLETVRTGGMVAKKMRSYTHPIGRLKVRGLIELSAER